MDVESIFAAALGKAPGAERCAFLDEACRGNHDLRQRIERLLEADDRTAGILERGADGPTEAPGEGGPPLLPERVFAGRFKLRQKLGERGMGAVWVADQADPRAVSAARAPAYAAAYPASRYAVYAAWNAAYAAGIAAVNTA